MAAIAQSLPATTSPLVWLWQWLRDELAPYSGRALLVTRMVTAATLIMIIGMTFRIPYSWLGAIYALLVSRESPRATVKSAATILLVTGICAAYIILSMRLVVNIVPLHFIWVVGTLFLTFYILNTLTNYLAAVAFVNTIAIGIPLWDRHVSAETNVEDTLWLCLAVLIAVLATAAVELVFVRRRRGDEILLLMTERLAVVEDLLLTYADGRSPDPAVSQKIQQFAMLGTSLLRRIVNRSNLAPEFLPAAGGAAVLVGRLVDLAAALPPLSLEFTENDRRRLRGLASTVAGIRNDLMNREIPAPVAFDTGAASAALAPLVGEMEHTVTLLTQVYADTRRADEQLPSLEPPMLLASDAFVNPEHLRFALKGCLAASLCFVIYNGLAWPGISTAVTTCLLTALSTIGASRQKQLLRITGAIAGGFFIGMGSQMFILPYLDITGFVILFAVVSALSAWIMTSSPRLSYFGVQVAVAFYLVNDQEFRIQTSLAVARDRVVGILFGLFVMWLVFDRLWGVTSAAAIVQTFSSNLRLIARFARVPVSNDLKGLVGSTLALRETINLSLDKTSALADGVLFEFGPSRQRGLELRDRIRRWQPQLRSLFVMRIASLKYRLQLPGFEMPEPVRLCQQTYDEASAQLLEQMADRIEGRPPAVTSRTDALLHEAEANASRELPVSQAQSFVALLHAIDTVTSRLAAEIPAELSNS